MTDESLTGEALFAKARAQLLAMVRPKDAFESDKKAANRVPFTDAERSELAQWANGGKPIESGPEGVDSLFEASRHRIAIDLIREYKVNSLGELPPEAFKS